MKRLRKNLAILLIICTALSACGGAETPTGDFSSEASGTQPSETAAPATTAATEPTSDIPEVTFPVTPETAPTTADPTSTGAVPATTDAVPGTTDAVPGTTDEPASTQSGTPAGPGDAKYVALTFDDGPDMRYTSSTSRILDTLEEYGAKATFFVLATQLDYNGYVDDAKTETFAQRNARLVKRAYDLGMQIGSHTYNHKDLNTLSTSEIQKELYDACAKTEAITGAKVTIMRPPYGNANQTVRSAIDMPMIIWDVDSLDWKTKDPDMIYDEVMKAVKPGSIILMHDIYNTTADGVAKVVPALIEKGYKFVTVSELYEIYGKTLEPHKVYMSAWYDD